MSYDFLDYTPTRIVSRQKISPKRPYDNPFSISPQHEDDTSSALNLFEFLGEERTTNSSANDLFGGLIGENTVTNIQTNAWRRDDEKIIEKNGSIPLSVDMEETWGRYFDSKQGFDTLSLIIDDIHLSSMDVEFDHLSPKIQEIFVFAPESNHEKLLTKFIIKDLEIVEFVNNNGNKLVMGPSENNIFIYPFEDLEGAIFVGGNGQDNKLISGVTEEPLKYEELTITQLDIGKYMIECDRLAKPLFTENLEELRFKQAGHDLVIDFREHH